MNCEFTYVLDGVYYWKCVVIAAYSVKLNLYYKASNLIDKNYFISMLLKIICFYTADAMNYESKGQNVDDMFLN